MSTVGGFLLFIVATLLFAWLSRRLLGANKVGAVQVLVSALVGVAAAAVVGGVLRRVGTEDESSIWVTAGVVAVLVTMAMVIALQLLRRPRDPRERRIGLIAGLRTSRRTAEVLRIAASHGLASRRGSTEDAPRPTGAQLRAALEEAGVVFVKLGQALAERPDLVTEPIARELAQLQTSVTPEPQSVMEPVLRQQLPDLDAVLPELDWSPLGSASIGQVYRARTAAGENVIVKIRRPGVREAVKRDSLVARNIAELLERNLPWARRIGLADVIDGLLGELARELDYVTEAQAMEEIAAALADSPIAIPGVRKEWSGPEVLVMEQVPGEPLSRARPVGPEAAAALAAAILGSMLGGDRFHADPHPGNVLIAEDGQLGLVDFGSTAVLPPHEQSSLRLLVMGIQLGEPALMRDALLGVAVQTKPIDNAALDRALAQLLAERISPSGGVNPRAVVDLLTLASDAGLRMPPSSGLLFRTLLTLLASLERLDPGYDVLQAAGRLTDADAQLPASPAELATVAQDEVLKVIPLLRRAPRLLDSVTTKLDRGDLSVHVRLFTHDQDVAFVNRLVNRTLLVIATGVLGVVSAMLFGLSKGPYLTPDFSVYDLLGAIGLLAGAVLLMRVLLEILQPAQE